MLKSSIITVGQYVNNRSKSFSSWFMNVENNNIECLYMAITCISFLVFVLNVVIINLAPKIVNVSCHDNVVSLSYNIIVSFCAYVFMLEWFFKSIKKIKFDVWGLEYVSLKHNIWIF